VFTGQNLATTGYIYNTNASSGANAGWHDARADAITVQMGCATLTSIAVRFRIEGRCTGCRTASLYNVSISAANAIDYVTNVTLRSDEIRVGAKLDSMVSTPLASPHNIYANIKFTDYRR